MKKLISVLFVMLLVLSIVGCGKPTGEVVSSSKVMKPIKIGYMGPLTGDAATYGIEEKATVEIAVQEINNMGGINGRPLEVVYEDSKCSGKDATSAAKKLIEVDKVKVILGGLCSGETLAAAPLAEEAKVVLISAFSSNPDIKNAGDYIFRTSVVDDKGGEAMAKLVAKDHKRAAILTENTDYARALGKIFEEQFEKMGGEIVASEGYDQDSKDYRAQLTKIKSVKPDAVVFNAQTGVSGGTGFVQAHELGVPGEYYGVFYASGNDFKELVGELAEGVKFIDAPTLDSRNPKAAKLLEKYTTRFGHIPNAQFMVGSRYDTVYMIKEAIENVGYDGTKIKDYLYGMKFSGVLGDVSFDSYGEPIGLEYLGFELRDGKQVALDNEVSLSGEPVKIGAMFPLTGDGAAYGVPLQKTADMAVEEINANGGINGRPLELIWEDGRCSPKDAATAVQKLINFDKVDVILGGVCSGETMGAAPLVEAAKVILFSPGSSSPDVTNAGDYVFRNAASDAYSGKVMAEYMSSQGLKTVGILTENTDYAQGIRKSFIARFDELGGNVLADETFNSDASDFRTQLTKIKGKNPDALYLLPQTPAKGGLVVQQAKELGLNMPGFTNEILGNENVVSNYGEYVEGYVFVEPGFDRESPEAKKVFASYKAKTGEEAPWPYYIATTYDAVHLLADALRLHGEDADAIKSYLYSVKGRPGAAGVLNIDSNGDAESEFYTKKIVDGKIVRLDAGVSEKTALSSEKIKIGVIVPLSGDAAFLGEGTRNSVQLALEELADSSNNEYEIIAEDDQMQAAKTVSAFHKLVGIDKVDVIVTISSGSGNAVADLGEEYKIPILNIASDANIVIGRKYSFTHWVTPEAEAEAYVKEAKKHGIEKIVTFTENQQGSIAIRDALKKVAPDMVVKDFVVEPEEKDFRTMILKARNSGADAMMTTLLPGHVALLVNQIRESGWDVEMTAIESFELEEDPNDVFEGLWFASGSEGTPEYRSAYEARFGKEPVLGSANAYDWGLILVDLFEKVGRDREAFTNELASLKDFKGNFGSIYVDADGKVISDAVIKKKVNGVITTLY